MIKTSGSSSHTIATLTLDKGIIVILIQNTFELILTMSAWPFVSNFLVMKEVPLAFAKSRLIEPVFDLLAQNFPLQLFS